MTNAFDLSALVEKFKAAGLPILEQDAKILTNVVFDWAKESVMISAATQPLYALLVPVLDQTQKLALAAEDKIDGITGN